MKYTTLSLLAGAATWLLHGVSAGAVNYTDPATLALIQELEENVPACALTCFITEVPASVCDLTNTTCICTDESLQTAMSVCIATESNCTVIEQLKTMRFEKNMCGFPVDNKTGYILPIVWTLWTIALIFVILRLIGRASQLGWHSWDDWTMCACFLALTPATVIGHLMVRSGLGQDIWNLEADQITNTLFYFFIEEYLYTFLVVFTKISILCLYLRIFTVHKFQIICHIFIGVVAAFGISCWVSTGFNCIPISYMWESWDGLHTGTCMDTSLQALALAGVNMSLDVIIMLLPIPQLLKLQMNNRRKLGIILMFTTGVFVTICSIVRLHTIMQFGNSTNPTLDYVPLAVWSLVEIDVGVMCACMPGIMALLQRLYPHLRTTRGGSSDNSYPRKSTGLSGDSTSGGGGGGGGTGLDSFRQKRNGFSRMDSPGGGGGGGGGLQHNISKTTSVTVSYHGDHGGNDRGLTHYDSKSEELELVDRPMSDQEEAARRGDIESGAPYRTERTPGAETRNYRSKW
ncbi:hypothetical protein BX600DRAFT_431868 [Xylariales sp. PMI_506]|nr:hypothetical protein BX600DRAFT_431868 [Xylariales sp. PMI_506]